MIAVLPLAKMSKSDKLRAMEYLWNDLTKDDMDLEAPEWHFQELKKTEELIKQGKVKFIGWEDAKKSLRRRAK